MVAIPHQPSRSNPMKKNGPATIYIDIETIPSQEMWVRDYIADTVKPPGNMKKVETIAEWERNEKQNAIDEAMEKCGLDGAMNHIICIGVAIDDHDPVTFLAQEHTDEKKVLKGLFDYLEENTLSYGNTFVGHNISGFDLKVIRQRCIILGIKPPQNIPFHSKPWDLNPFDTMVQWSGAGKDFVKLDKIAKALGIAGKSKGMDGSQVYKMWKNGLIEQISDYCKADVDMTRAVHKKMVFQS